MNWMEWCGKWSSFLFFDVSFVLAVPVYCETYTRTIRTNTVRANSCSCCVQRMRNVNTEKQLCYCTVCVKHTRPTMAFVLDTRLERVRVMYAECLLTNSILFFLFWRFNGSAAFVFLLDMKSLRNRNWRLLPIFVSFCISCGENIAIGALVARSNRSMQLHEYYNITCDRNSSIKTSYRSQTQCMRAEFKFGSDLISSECVYGLHLELASSTHSHHLFRFTDCCTEFIHSI